MEIQTFTKDYWSVGCPVIVEQTPWFKGKDVATSLEYANPLKAIRDHVDDADKKPFNEFSQGVNEKFTLSNQQPHEVYINESGLYCLVLRSNKPQAKSFKRWVTTEVLPSIRKHGSYGIGLGGAGTTGLTEQFKELHAAITVLTQRLDTQSQIQGVNDRLSSIEKKVDNIPEYGPRIEMSRGFPIDADELTTIGVKLEAAEDIERLQEFGLPTSTLLQETFSGKR